MTPERVIEAAELVEAMSAHQWLAKVNSPMRVEDGDYVSRIGRRAMAFEIESGLLDLGLKPQFFSRWLNIEIQHCVARIGAALDGFFDLECEDGDGRLVVSAEAVFFAPPRLETNEYPIDGKIAVRVSVCVEALKP